MCFEDKANSTRVNNPTELGPPHLGHLPTLLSMPGSHSKGPSDPVGICIARARASSLLHSVLLLFGIYLMPLRFEVTP